MQQCPLGTLASTRHAHARGATIRTELIHLAARPAHNGRDTITWHLPDEWPWADPWITAFEATRRRPPTRAA